MPERSFAAIIRHGAYFQRPETPSARQPFGLTPEGLQHARAGAETLDAMIKERGLKVNGTMYCSRQLRAWQTAMEIMACLQQHGHDVSELHQTSALAERGLGSAANLTLEEIEQVLSDDPRYDRPPSGWKADSDYRLPLEGAESLMDAGARVARHLSDTTAANPGVVTIHVGHGASFRHACFHLGVLRRDEIAQLSMFHGNPLLICYKANASWEKIAGSWKVRRSREDALD